MEGGRPLPPCFLEGCGLTRVPEKIVLVGFLVAFFLVAAKPGIRAADDLVGRVCDRNGILLIEVRSTPDGGVVLSYPLRALGAQLLSGLDPAVLPRKGETLYLTIDVHAQLAAEHSLRKVPRGCAVVMNSGNGDILAMASVPSFDPNSPDLAALEADPADPRRNRAVSAVPPGATFLPVTLLSGLAAGFRDFQHECTGSMAFGNQGMKCWIADKGGGHGKETLNEGMRNSCSTFFYRFGMVAGVDKIGSVAATLGFGKASGIPVRNEAAGLVPGIAWLKKVNPQATWTDGYTANLAIGQGDLLATPLQMTAMAATIGQGGTVIKPRLIERIVHQDGTISRPEPIAPPELEEVGIRKEDVAVVRNAMRNSVNESGGNARKAATPGFLVGGRTGTSQIWRNGLKDSVAAFVGFAESEKNHFAFGVFVLGAKSGGGVAAPLASQILAGLEAPVGQNELTPRDPAKGSFDFVESGD